VLQDYAGRHWSGLVGGYYLPRWRIWLRALEEGMDVERFEAELRAFEEGWLADPQPGPAEPLPDAVAVAAAVRDRYRDLAAAHNGLRRASDAVASHCTRAAGMQGGT